MTLGQRWIAVIAVGAGFWATASTLNTRLDQRNPDGGWFNYAPNNGAVFSPSLGSPWRSPAVWLVAILLWFAFSYRMLQKGEEDR